ncbi:MAG: hypothetical protein O7A06_11325 [Acidobacteria bacterium]|nr:hypothetical protein [Acidobacteriota bacterium]
MYENRIMSFFDKMERQSAAAQPNIRQSIMNLIIFVRHAYHRGFPKLAKKTLPIENRIAKVLQKVAG